MRDSVFVIMTGPSRALDLREAVVLDLDGNGVLDALRMVFERMVDVRLRTAEQLAATVHLRWGAIDWTVEGITGAQGTLLDSVFVADLVEVSPDVPQTGLRGELWVDSLCNGWAGLDTLTCGDGAGPVIHAVTVTPSCSGCAHSLVTVVLSERVQQRHGSLTPDIPPGSFLLAHVLTTNDRYEASSAVLGGIDALTSVVDTTIDSVAATAVCFTMDNGLCLTTAHAFTLDTTSEHALHDYGLPFANGPSSAQSPVHVTEASLVCADTDDDTDTGCGDCGTGSEQALLPLLWFGGRGLWRRQRRRSHRA